MEKIMEILAKIRPEYDYSSSVNFIEDGMLDSFDVITLVSEIEENYAILIDALDIVPENFASAEAIAKLIVSNGGKL